MPGSGRRLQTAGPNWRNKEKARVQMKSVSQFCKSAVFASAVAYASNAAAQDGSALASALPVQTEGAEVMSLEDMEDLSGGTGVTAIIDTNQVLTAINAGNSVSGNVVGSGQVNIGAGAFSGYEGIGNFVINTGHNNNLQSSMNVSVLLPPPSPSP
jgi:hypothetical protein